MIITKRSPLTGEINSLDVPCTQAQLDAWKAGELIQNAMPNVPAELREFLITGYTPDDWKKLFGSSNENI